MNYQRVHDDIIQKARSQSRIYGCGIYYERHHIIPKCIGGSGKTHQWKTHPNIILLTAREHFIVHQLLVKIYPSVGKLKSALWFMCNQKAVGRDYLVSSRLYEEAKLEHLAQIQGVPKSKEHRLKLSEAKKGVSRGPMNDEWRTNLKRSITGIKKTDTHKHNLSKAKSIPRYQYNLDGTFIRKWNSAKEAGVGLGVDSSDITRCCKGTRKTVGGYIWKYERDCVYLTSK